MLAIKKLNQYYGDSHTLWDLDFNVERGTCTCLMGRNGVGKTTLLKCIMGLLPTRSGAIEFNGQDISQLPAEHRAQMRIGYVPQGREIFSRLTVEENLRVGLASQKSLASRGSSSKDIPNLVFELFPVLKEMLQRRGGDLSGGQQQQLAIGRALAVNPTLLILDEPCEGIQPNIVSLIGDIITKLNKEMDVTVLLVEQKIGFTQKIATNFCIMERGKNVVADDISALSDDLISEYLVV